LSEKNIILWRIPIPKSVLAEECAMRHYTALLDLTTGSGFDTEFYMLECEMQYFESRQK